MHAPFRSSRKVSSKKLSSYLIYVQRSQRHQSANRKKGGNCHRAYASRDITDLRLGRMSRHQIIMLRNAPLCRVGKDDRKKWMEGRCSTKSFKKVPEKPRYLMYAVYSRCQTVEPGCRQWYWSSVCTCG